MVSYEVYLWHQRKWLKIHQSKGSLGQEKGFKVVFLKFERFIFMAGQIKEY